jgi:cell wall-associated NlpC family hydrolase
MRQVQMRKGKAMGRPRGMASRNRALGPTAEEFVQKCLEEKGDEYEWRGEYAPGTPAGETREWDCSGLVYTKLMELGIDPPRNSTAHLNWCRENGTLISVDEAIGTRGALLLREGHVAVSLGDGQTIEGMGEKWGVGVFSAYNRTFTDGGLVPGLTYNGTRTPPEKTEPKAPGGATARPTLRRGSTGESVRFLQTKLKQLGYDPGPIDGIFGAGTERAVKNFPADKGLVVDGIVGKQTWGALT